MTRITLHEAADAELNEAASYYESKARGLGVAFLGEVQTAFDRLRANPESAAPLARGLRRLVLRRFPYSLIFAIESDCLRVIAIAHQRRRPAYWAARSSQ